MHADFPEFLESIADAWGCDTVVCLGDLVDWHCISFHEKTTGAQSACEEYDRAKEQVAKIHKLFPKATWIHGNHDALPQRQLAASVRASFPSALLDLVSPRRAFDTPGWKHVDRFGSIDIDGVNYSHGDGGAGGKTAALNQAIQNFQSSVIGHFHSQCGIWRTANQRDCCFGLAAGCGVDHDHPAMQYGRRFKSKPILGCGVVIDGDDAYSERMKL